MALEYQTNMIGFEWSAILFETNKLDCFIIKNIMFMTLINKTV
jgi:hypothetical protein